MNDIALRNAVLFVVGAIVTDRFLLTHETIAWINRARFEWSPAQCRARRHSGMSLQMHFKESE